MPIQKDAPDAKAPHPDTTADGRNETKSANAEAAAVGNPDPAPALEITSVAAMKNREIAVTTREEVSHAREETATHRESAVEVREEAVHARESVSSSREQNERRAESTRENLVEHIGRLREANKHLVVSAVKAQIMTEEVKRAKDQMDHMAHYDFLTDLPNRLHLTKRLIHALALAKRNATRLAVMFIDLDRFKVINDSLGHAIGDALLQAVGNRLKASMRSSDMVSRQGGDEFVVLLLEISDEKTIGAFADKIIKTVSAPYMIAEQALHIGATIGISRYPEDGEEAEALIRNADLAMYHAKNSGRNKFHFFKAEMNSSVIERQRMEGDLYRGLEQKEFELFYQAQIVIDTGSIFGVEALIRWRHPQRGFLSPSAFVTIAEHCGAIVPIGRWVLRQACWQAQTWLDAGLHFQNIAVNISAIEFEKNDFLANLLAILGETRLAPNYLELELTETVLMKNAEATLALLQELKSMGIRISIDDFGTGYSSMSYLKQFPVHTMKIDQSFVSNLLSHENDGMLVDSMINLGKSLNYCVIAEGVETPEQLAFLKQHHCTAAQGYYLSRPMAAEPFSELLTAGLSKNLWLHPSVFPDAKLASPPC